MKGKSLFLCMFIVFVLIFSAMTVKAETYPQLLSSFASGYNLAINGDGRYIVFQDYYLDEFFNEKSIWVVYDRQLGSKEEISFEGETSELITGFPVMSPDGRYLVLGIYNYLSRNLRVVLFDRLGGSQETLNIDSNGALINECWGASSISNDGRYITLRCSPPLIFDRLTGVMRNLNVAPDGSLGNGICGPTILSADGHYVFFTSSSSNLVPNDTNGTSDIFMQDLSTGITQRVLEGSYSPDAVSADGRYILIRRADSQPLEMFVYDRLTGEKDLVNKLSDGSQPFSNPCPYYSGLSADGRYVVFEAYENVPSLGHTNNKYDIFVHDRISDLTECVSVKFDGSQGLISSNDEAPGVISADGRYIAFISGFSDLVSTENYKWAFSNVYPYVTLNPLFESKRSQAPVANAGLDQTVHVSSVATLDGSKSSDSDENYPLSYHWFFSSVPTGSKAVIQNPSAVNPTFVADVMGEYVVSLLVRDQGRMPSQIAQVKISTINTAPIAYAGKDQLVTVIGTQVTLSGKHSFDDDGDSLTYKWSIISKPESSSVALSNPATEAPTFIADMHGVYVFALRVADSWATSEPDLVTVGFENIKPVADAGVNQSVAVGNAVDLDGSGSSDANGDRLDFFWNLASVPQGSQAILSPSDTVTTSFVADLPGEYVANLVVTDGFEASEISSVTIMTITKEEDEAVNTLREAISVINSLSDEQFNNPNNKNALTNKINATLGNIESDNFAVAVNQLRNDVITKFNGCAILAVPDKTDWITTLSKESKAEEIQVACQAQDQVYLLIQKAIGYLEVLL